MAAIQVLPSSRVPDPIEAPPLKWGILGPGGIARHFTAALRNATRQQLVAVGSRSLEKAQSFAAEFGVPRAHGSYAALLADPEVQVVYVATPHSEHAALALAAIEAGKHVLVEKAFTRNAKEARRVVAAASKQGVALMEAMWTRFLPHIDIVRQLLADGALGEIETVLADHGQRLDEVERLHDPALAGGALLDLGVYPVSFVSFVLGRPGLIRSVGALTPSGVDRQASVVLGRFESQQRAQALVSTTLAAKTPTTASISGRSARIELDGDFYQPGRVRLVTASGEVILSPEPRLRGHLGLAFEAAHFAQLIADGFTESPQLPLEETIAVMEVLDEVRTQLRVRFPGE